MTVTTPAPAHGVDAILEGLNPEQVDAVTQRDGPVLIVAGAGTGKTQVITRRIAWLIATKKARPEEILALTFTEKAAAEMEARVDVLVPYGYTGATISTFHAFGDRLVRDFAIELGIPGRLRTCTEPEILVFLGERLFALALERYAPLGDPSRHLRLLVRLFNRARDEDVSPEAYQAFAAALAAGAGDDAARRDRAASEIEKARAYARYRDLLLAHGRLDFGDQVALALRLLRERAHIRRQIQDQYRYILVDEFQDTNAAQFELLRLLAGDRRNLMVVGDDDQSIYGFRGAKMTNLVAFLDAFPDAGTVSLVRNYRSRQGILDAAYRLIQVNGRNRLEATLRERGGAHVIDKRLRAERAGEARIEPHEYETGTDEAAAVAAHITRALGEGRRPGEIAVLARQHKNLVPILNALDSEGVPFQQSGEKRLYQREEVRLALAVLRAIADPNDSTAVFELLAAPLFGAEDTDLARLSSIAHRRHLGLRRVIERLVDEPGFQEVADTTREAASRLVTLLRQLGHLAPRRPTTDVLYAFVHESGYLARLIAEDSPEAEARVRNLAKLFSIARRIGEGLEEDRVDRFIRHLDLLIEAGDDPVAAEVEVDLDAVQVMTLHAAKGLEFPVVFLVAMTDANMPGREHGSELDFPAELVHGAATAGDFHTEEQRRLFYVGMTRAMDELHLTSALDYGGRIRRKMSRFVAEALAIDAKAARRTAPSARETIERHAPAPPAPAAARPPLRPDELLALSSSRIDDYLTCPLKYRWAHEVRIPLAGDPRFMYGNAIHHAILVYYQHRLRGLPLSATDVGRVFEQSWSSEGFLSREHEERRLAQGKEALARFVEREDAAPRRTMQAEQTFTFRVGLNVVSGRWDRVDARPDGVVIVDFKTTDVDEEEDAQTRAVESLRNGQLGVYALAYRETRRITPVAVELHYVGSGAVGAAAVEDDHLVDAEERIATAAAGIRAADFTPRPDYNACRMCPFSTFCPHSYHRGP